MKPMLAVEAGQFCYPIYASVKLDGIRAIIKDDMVLSRSLKRIPNNYVQDTLGANYLPNRLNGLDGELTVGPAWHKNVMQATTSGVMSRDGEPDFTYWVFDFWTDQAMQFEHRLQMLQNVYKSNRVNLLPQVLINSQGELDAYEASVLEQGYEGVILRSPAGRYKYGRSTAREAYLLKLKRFVDAEAVVIGVEERMHNSNEATVDNLGQTTRSSHQGNLVPMNTMGALLVEDVNTGVEFSIGTGFDDALRKYVWEYRVEVVGAIVTYKHFEVGSKDKPRFPVFKCFRSRFDME